MNPCAICGGPPAQAHHVIYRQHLKGTGADVDDPRNLLSICLRHHARHHTATERIPVSKLRDENLAFARELLGLAAYDYFVRRYADDGDERLFGLLEEEVA